MVRDETLDKLFDAAKTAGVDLNDLNEWHELLAEAEVTTVELYQEAGNRVAMHRGDQRGAAAREYSLAITATEDAIMRFNRGQAEERGVRRDYDFEREGR